MANVTAEGDKLASDEEIARALHEPFRREEEVSAAARLFALDDEMNANNGVSMVIRAPIVYRDADAAVSG